MPPMAPMFPLHQFRVIRWLACRCNGRVLCILLIHAAEVLAHFPLSAFFEIEESLCENSVAPDQGGPSMRSRTRRWGGGQVNRQ